MNTVYKESESEILMMFKNKVSNQLAYECAYEFFTKIASLVQRVERTMDRAMVTRLSEASIDMLVAIYRLHLAADKVQAMADVCMRMEVVQLLLRLIKDFNLIAVFYISDLEDYIKKVNEHVLVEYKTMTR